MKPSTRTHRTALVTITAVATSVLTTVMAAPATAAVPDRSVFAAGNAVFSGSTGDTMLNGPLVDMAASPTGGYWQLGSDGGVFSYGGAGFFGSTGDIRLNKPVVSMSPTRSGQGYWFVASDGGIFNYGDAGFFGSTGAMTLNQPIVGMAPTKSGNGYFLVASDGGVFAFGDATFSGSLGDRKLWAPIVGLSPLPTGDGYWLLDEAGDVYPFGTAAQYREGPLEADETDGTNFTDIEATPSGNGFWMIEKTGRVLAFGDAAKLQPEVTLGPGQAAIGVDSTADGGGLWVSTNGRYRPNTADAAGSYEFSQVDFQGRPGRWNPCAPITWLFNPESAPVGAEQFLREGFDYMGSLTGLQFRYGGTTSAFPDATMDGTIIVGWVPLHIINGAAPVQFRSKNGALYVGAAAIQLNANYNNDVVLEDGDITFLVPGLTATWGANGWGSTFLHEFGHVLGLGHAGYGLMMPWDGGDHIYGPGDLAGIHRLGAAAGCL